MTHPKSTGVICRECGTLQSGIEAGLYVKWVTCKECDTRNATIASLQSQLRDAEARQLTREEFETVIEAIRLHHMALNYIGGFDSPIYKKLRSLSTGSPDGQTLMETLMDKQPDLPGS